MYKSKWLSFAALAGTFMFFQNFTYQEGNRNTGMPVTPVRSWVDFACATDANNKGCYGRQSCPVGMRPLQVRAVCNLEKSTIPAGALNSTPVGLLKVVQKSSRTSDGACYIDAYRASSTMVAIEKFSPVVPYVKFGCSEQESNGGDCAIQGQVLCEEYYGPLYMMQPRTKSSAVAQGLSRLDAEHFIISTDTGNDTHITVNKTLTIKGKKQIVEEKILNNGSISFSIVTNSGALVADFNLPYNSHGQNITVSKKKSYFQILVSSADYRGLAEFQLSDDFSQMRFVREIIPQSTDGDLSVSAFSVDEPNDRIGVVYYDHDEKIYHLDIFQFSKFLRAEKNLKVVNRIRLHPDQKKPVGFMQGVALSKNFAYVISGNNKLLDKNDETTFKRLFRYKLDGGSASPALISVASSSAREEGIHYEPEGLFLEKGRLYFTMNSGPKEDRIIRMFSMSEKFWPK